MSKSIACRAAAWSAVLWLALVSAGCSRSDAAGGGPGGPPPVSVVPAVQRTVQDAESFVARLEAPQTVELRSRVAGPVEQVHFADGQRVARGALLFTIDARPFAAEVARTRAQLASSRTQGELAAAELARAERLLPMKAVSQQEIDQLRASLRSSEAAVQAAQAALTTAELNLGHTRITAPVAGRVGRAEVTAGNLVGVGEPRLATLVATDRIHAWFDASESAYLRYRAAQRQAAAPAAPAAGPAGSAPQAAKPVQPAAARGNGFTVQMGLADEPGHPHSGRIDFVDNRLDAATGTIRMRAVFDNAAGLFTPGLSARLRLAGTAPYDATLVPDRAIGTDQSRKVVLVVGADGIVQQREVRPGGLFGGMRVVQGVKPGENVIVDGLQRAFPGAPVAATVLKQDAAGMPLPPAPGAAPQGR